VFRGDLDQDRTACTTATRRSGTGLILPGKNTVGGVGGVDVLRNARREMEMGNIWMSEEGLY